MGLSVRNLQEQAQIYTPCWFYHCCLVFLVGVSLQKDAYNTEYGSKEFELQDKEGNTWYGPLLVTGLDDMSCIYCKLDL